MLIYLTNSRPDITYAIQQLSQHMHAPMTLHYDAAIKVLRYIKNAPAQGLFYRAYSTLQLKAFGNSDLGHLPICTQIYNGLLHLHWPVSHIIGNRKSNLQSHDVVQKLSTELLPSLPANYNVKITY